MRTPFDTKSRPAATFDRQARPASNGSVNYLRDLMLDKAAHGGTDEDQAAINIDAWLAKDHTQREVSENIDRLKGEGYTGRRYRAAKKAEANVTFPDAQTVPAGRYAVYNDDQSANDIAFYQVDRPTEGRWAGYVFVNRYSSDELIRISREQQVAIMDKIVKMGAAESSALYGRNDVRCGICHRKLTKKASRDRGIGPDCAAALGW